MGSRELTVSGVLDSLRRGAHDLQCGAAEVKRGIEDLKREAEHRGVDIERALLDTRKAIKRTAAVAIRDAEHLLHHARKSVVKPAEKRIRAAYREFVHPKPAVPTWAKVSLSIVGVAAAIYGLSKIDSVREFMRPVTDPVGDMFDASREAVESFAAEL